jgi:hypothetical protein
VVDNASVTSAMQARVPGLNAVDVVASAQAGGATACNGTADNTATGLAYTGTAAFGPDPAQNWRYVLALIYGGLDITTGVVDCNQAARQTLVSSYSSLFQDACTNPFGSCSDPPRNGALWHAFRLDDSSQASAVFAAAVGLSPAPSASALNGFGTSPFCNSLNWDTSPANASCANGAHEQWTGPGGVGDPASSCVIGGPCGAAGSGNHHRPPPGTWGDNPDPSQGALGADVLPTQLQDNDPIRRFCLGGATNNTVRAGEEVCNLDGRLGLVIPIVDSSWMPTATPPLKQYPTNFCTTFDFGTAPVVFTCAVRGTGTKHTGECPNGDSLIAGGCLVPIDGANGTSQCVASKATVAALQARSLGNPDGRVYNTQMRDGTLTTVSSLIGYAKVPVPSSTTTIDFAGNYGRIHEVESAIGNYSLGGCQQLLPTDQIGCLVQTDPCSIGFAGDGARTWGANARVNALRVSQVYPTSTTVANGQYPLSCAGTGSSCQF